VISNAGREGRWPEVPEVKSVEFRDGEDSGREGK